MPRQILVHAIKPALRASLPTYRTLSTSITRLAEGDTGAPRSGGSAQSDAFSKREQADEDRHVRMKEKETIEKLRAKLQEHKKQLDDLDQTLDDPIKPGQDSKEETEK